MIDIGPNRNVSDSMREILYNDNGVLLCKYIHDCLSIHVHLHVRYNQVKTTTSNYVYIYMDV